MPTYTLVMNQRVNALQQCTMTGIVAPDPITAVSVARNSSPPWVNNVVVDYTDLDPSSVVQTAP